MVVLRYTLASHKLPSKRVRVESGVNIIEVLPVGRYEEAHELDLLPGTPTAPSPTCSTASSKT